MLKNCFLCHCKARAILVLSQAHSQVFAGGVMLINNLWSKCSFLPRQMRVSMTHYSWSTKGKTHQEQEENTALVVRMKGIASNQWVGLTRKPLRIWAVKAAHARNWVCHCHDGK